MAERGSRSAVRNTRSSVTAAPVDRARATTCESTSLASTTVSDSGRRFAARTPWERSARESTDGMVSAAARRWSVPGLTLASMARALARSTSPREDCVAVDNINRVRWHIPLPQRQFCAQRSAREHCVCRAARPTLCVSVRSRHRGLGPCRRRQIERKSAALDPRPARVSFSGQHHATRLTLLQKNRRTDATLCARRPARGDDDGSDGS